MLTRFTATGFRNLSALDVELGRVNVFIGANNCGKTNLFEAVDSLRQLVAQGGPNGVDLGNSLSGLGGVHLPASGGDGTVRLGWSFASIEYEVELWLPGDPARWHEWRVRKERLDAGSWRYLAATNEEIGGAPPGTGVVVRDGVATAVRPGLVHDRYTAGSSMGWRFPVGSSNLPELETAFSVLGGEAAGLAFASFPRHAGARDQVGQRREGDDRLSVRGDNLAHVLRELEQHPPFLDPVFARLRHLVPDLVRLGTADAQGSVWANLTVGGSLRPLWTFSDGTVQALRLAMLLFRSRHRTVLLDEPELSLHPAWQREVANWLLDSEVQTLVATHSPELLDALTPAFVDGRARLFVMEPRAVRRVDPRDFGEDLDAGWEFGDFYRQGFPALGGWPR